MSRGTDQEIETLARAIASAEVGSELLALARRVAEAELRLRCVRRAQMITARPLENFRADSSGVVHGASRNVVIPLRSLGKDFEASALDRYERRARSRRKFAIRDYAAARTALVALQRPIEN
jgi:hypothetical protein